jgi:hypothetical protein
MRGRPAPRIYCLSATESPVVAVFLRGPNNWSHVGRWEIDKGLYELGAWLSGRIFPRRSDLSPDGRYLCYFAHKPSATWEHGDSYVAVSKLPWLTALIAFGTCGTWTRGYRFVKDGGKQDVKLPTFYGLCLIPVVQFAHERLRCWEEAPDCPPRNPVDIWDPHRNSCMRKRQPGSDRFLYVESLGWAGGEFSGKQAVDGMHVRYSFGREGELQVLDDLQWADWDRNGRLLVATREGKLQIRNIGLHGAQIFFEEDLSLIEPNPAPAPAWACHW